MVILEETITDIIICNSWVFYSRVVEDSGLLGCDTASLVKCYITNSSILPDNSVSEDEGDTSVQIGTTYPVTQHQIPKNSIISYQLFRNKAKSIYIFKDDYAVVATVTV
jgi:hypothetical protein